MYVGLSFLSTKYLRPNSPDLYSLIHLLGWIILQGIVQILVCLILTLKLITAVDQSLVIHTIHFSSCKNKTSFMGNEFSFTSKQTRNELRICCSIEEIFVLEQIGANTNPGIFENLLMKIIDEKQEQDSGDDIMGKAPLLIV